MLYNYLKIAFRSLWNNKLYSALNISGLGLGIAVGLLTGLWVYDEISFDTGNRNYDRIAIIQKNRTHNGTINTENTHSIPLAAKLKETYGNLFDVVALSSYAGERTFRYGDKTVVKRGHFMDTGGQEILDLKIVQGAVVFPLDPTSILISESFRKSLFGEENPLEKIVRIDNKIDLKIAGVYQDMPQNSAFNTVAFYSTFSTFAQLDAYVREGQSDWNENSFSIYVKLAPNVDMAVASAAIKNTVYDVTKDASKPELFLQPMSEWHLYPEYNNGTRVGAGLQILWIFGMIGVFVLLLAAINFMTLSTARSEKRSKEIGIRKSIGSMRGQLIKQFYTETFLVVFFAGIAGMTAAQAALPWFNRIAEKQLVFAWSNPVFWFPLTGFMAVTGLIAGSYPAFYLSSFNPVHILKGKFKTGQKEIFSRKALVIFQFSISVTLIISTIIIVRQIQFAKDRPMGYESSGLIQMQKRSPNLIGHFFAMRQDLHDSGAVVEMAESSGPLHAAWTTSSGLHWKGKDEGAQEDFITRTGTPEFGKTIGWNVLQGRDFSREFSSDTACIILNESAVKMMGFKDPLNETIEYQGKNFQVIGVTKDLVMESPYDPVRPTVFTMQKANMPFISIRLNPDMSASQALGKVEAVLKKYDPEGSFNFKFVDAQVDRKFRREERIANMATAFSILAVFISLLGIFGLASFVAEQRTKEIGVRKVLGASVAHVWGLLSGDFVVLVVIAFSIAAPLSYSIMSNWLMNYEYRTGISGWIFAAAGFGTLAITLLTVSFQAVRVAGLNPVKTLKSE